MSLDFDSEIQTHKEEGNGTKPIKMISNEKIHWLPYPEPTSETLYPGIEGDSTERAYIYIPRELFDMIERIDTFMEEETKRKKNIFKTSNGFCYKSMLHDDMRYDDVKYDGEQYELYGKI